MDRKNEFLLRVYSVLILFIVSAAFLFTRVYRIAITDGDKWRAAGDSLYIKYAPVEAERGNILDARGNLLSTTLQFFDIGMDLNSTGMKDEDFINNVDSLGECLSRYVDASRTPQQWTNYLIRKRKEGSRYLQLKSKVTYIDKNRIKDFPLFRLGRYKGGLIIEPKNKRHVPFHELGRRTIGVYRENAPVVGLEGYFNDILSGEDGKQLVQKVSHGIWIPLNDLMEVEPKRGMDIKSTLDMEIQDVTQNALLKALEHHHAEFGVAIVMEVETGAIKAIANLQEVEGGYAEIYNHAVGTHVEPGSTMKLASIMALLEDDFVSLDDSISLSYGKARFCKTTDLHDSEPHGFDEVTIQKAFEKSSNVGMARLTSRYYTDANREQQFINRLKQFHLDKPTGVEINGEAKPYVKNSGDERWSCLSVPWMSIGYEILLTPLQMLTLYNAVANDGKMMKPYLVSEIRSKNKLVKSFKPRVVDNSIARPGTIEKAKALLEGVVERGTAKKIQSKYLRFAGKTGTAQVDYDGNGKKKHQASFAGYFPADDPRYSCIVLVRNPRRNGYYGGTVAGPVFKEIAEKTIGIEYLQTEGQVATGQSEIEPEQRYPAYQVAYRQETRSILKHTGAKFRESGEDDYVVLLPEGDSLLLKERTVDRGLVPNVLGMSLKDALYVLENRGLNTTVNGYGRVAAQSIPPGSALEDQKIELILK